MSDKLWYNLAGKILRSGGPPVPINETLIELLKTVLDENEEQVKFLLIFNKPLRLDQIKEKLALDNESLNKMLDDLMYVGLLTGIPSRSTGVMIYRLVAFLPGLLEFTLMRGETGEKQKKLAQIWDKLFKEGAEMLQKNFEVAMEAYKNAPAIDRVVPVEEQIDPQEEKVIPIEEVHKIVDRYDDIGVSYCYCRHRKDLLNDPCEVDAPRHNCLSFGRTAKFAIDYDFAERITKEEALKLLREAEDLGLVHKTFHVRGNPELEELAICNCCKCCCGSLSAYHKGTGPMHTLTSYMAKINKEKCVGCGTCVEKCPMEAIELSNNVAKLNAAKCIGCGVCAHLCLEKAINLNRTGLRDVFIIPQQSTAN
jgi:Pyruvate/2-oxoacid:ferredoxin oxidoreductase delta subunit